MRNLFAFIVGSGFGTGLWLSGMTDTRKVQGWLDIFGAWDPTLAFVVGGALIPMAIAWRMTRDTTPALGGEFPSAPGSEISNTLIFGSVLFGAGWGLAGLCPGPAIASLSWGGASNVVFLVTMAVGMLAAPTLRGLLESPPRFRTT